MNLLNMSVYITTFTLLQGHFYLLCTVMVTAIWFRSLGGGGGGGGRGANWNCSVMVLVNVRSWGPP